MVYRSGNRSGDSRRSENTVSLLSQCKSQCNKLAYDKSLRQRNLWRRKVYSGSEFGRFMPIAGWSHCSHTFGETCYHDSRVWQRTLLTEFRPGSKTERVGIGAFKSFSSALWHDRKSSNQALLPVGSMRCDPSSQAFGRPFLRSQMPI